MRKVLVVAVLVCVVMLAGCFTKPVSHVRSYNGSYKDFYGKVTYHFLSNGYALTNAYEDRGIVNAKDRYGNTYTALITGDNPVSVSVTVMDKKGSDYSKLAKKLLDELFK